MKPGYRTTEFWITVSIILIAAATGILAVVYGKTAYEKAEAIVPLAIAFLKAHGYSAGRVKQKIEQIIKHYEGCDPVNLDPTPQPTPPPTVVITPPTPATPITITPPSDDDDSKVHSVTISTKVMKNSTAITTTIK